MDLILIPLLQVVGIVLSLLNWAVLIYVILGWLVLFKAVNPSSPGVASLGTSLSRILGPLLAPLRRIIPSIGGFDLSLIALLLILYFLQSVVGGLILRMS